MKAQCDRLELAFMAVAETLKDKDARSQERNRKSEGKACQDGAVEMVVSLM